MSEEVFLGITVESTNPFTVLKSVDYLVKGMNNSCLISQVAVRTVEKITQTLLICFLHLVKGLTKASTF